LNLNWKPVIGSKRKLLSVLDSLIKAMLPFSLWSA
jgi:hypothetical protein